jgi:hypothetical protein
MNELPRSGGAPFYPQMAQITADEGYESNSSQAFLF